MHVASFGLEIAGKYKDPLEDEKVKRALQDIGEWEWSEFMKVKLKGRAENWDATNKEHHNAMIRRVFEKHPNLIGGTTTVVIDAMHQVSDPNRAKTLQAHKGLHLETMRATASQLHDLSLLHI